jgi:hypothetical protein
LKLFGEKLPDEVQQIKKAKVAETLFEMHHQLIKVIKQEPEKFYGD